MQEAVNARLIMILSSFWWRYLVDEQVGQRPGLEGQRIGIVHRTLAHHDLGGDLEFRDALRIGRNKRRAAEGAPSRPLRRPVRLVSPDRPEILHPEAEALPFRVTRR